MIQSVVANHGNINGNINHSLDDYERIIVELVLKNPRIFQDCIVEKTGLSKRTISRVMKSLKEKEILIRKGANESGIWLIKR